LYLLFSTIESPRRELENVVKRARKDRDQSQYWINKVLEAEEKDPNRYAKNSTIYYALHTLDQG